LLAKTFTKFVVLQLQTIISKLAKHPKWLPIPTSLI
jgi:hypothetical protein